MITQLEGGHKVKYAGRASDQRNNEFIKKIVDSYNTYKADNTVGTYLRAISYRIKRYNYTENEESNEEDEDDNE